MFYIFPLLIFLVNLSNLGALFKESLASINLTFGSNKLLIMLDTYQIDFYDNQEWQLDLSRSNFLREVFYIFSTFFINFWSYWIGRIPVRLSRYSYKYVCILISNVGMSKLFDLSCLELFFVNRRLFARQRDGIGVGHFLACQYLRLSVFYH